MNEINPKRNEYAKAVSLFLAELLRTRKTSLARASEIAQKVLENINLIDTEQQFLEFVKVLTSDFEELHHLGEIFYMHVKISERQDLEQKVRVFVIHIMSQDLDLAAEVLKQAINENLSLNDLCARFPAFKDFIQHFPKNNAGTIHDQSEIIEERAYI
jgi:hypothetical protein